MITYMLKFEPWEEPRDTGRQGRRSPRGRQGSRGFLEGRLHRPQSKVSRQRQWNGELVKTVSYIVRAVGNLRVRFEADLSKSTTGR